MTWIDFAKDFQTAIVGIIGFTGVIFAQLLNAHLTRKRDDASQRRKRDAVTAAFEVEIKQFRNFFLQLDPKKPPEKGNLALRPRSRRIVTPMLMIDIGLINTTSLDDVLYALLVIDALDNQSSVFASSVTDTHLGFDADVWPKMAKATNEAAESLDKALASLHSAKR
ncbi:MAG: hypothetical protein P1U84_17610 [Parvibaculaceae bacterium]|nr:hypothetical protein [Parvibaculaceae bacterium]